MANILVRDVPENTVESLKLLAKKQGRSMSAEVRRILEAEVERQQADEEHVARRTAFWEWADSLRSEIASTHGQLRDSAELLREDRDSDYGNAN